MPTHTGYDSSNKPPCFAQWGNSGKKYYYTCGDKGAMDEAKAKANAQGQAIRASGWTESKKFNEKGDENNLKVIKDKAAIESYEEKIQKVRNAFEGNNTSQPMEAEVSSIMVVYTFDSSVILKDYNTQKYYEADYSILPDGNIVKGVPKEVELTYVQKRLFAESLDFSSIKNIDDIKNALDEVKKYDWSWAGSFTKCVEILTDKPGIDNPEGLCSWLHHEAEGKWPGEKAREEIITKEKGCELTGPIVMKNEAQRIVYAAVLVPGEPDYDYDKGEKILTREEIERVAHKWMLDYMNIDVMHSLNNVAKPVETFLLPMEWNVEAYGQKLKLPIGTWVMASKVVDDITWKKVESGELTGYSVMGIRNTALKSLLDSASKGKDILEEIKAVLKKTLIKDLGEDWIVPFVSLVDEACVPKSKFFAIKGKDKNDTEGVINRLINFVKGKKEESEKGILDIANSLKDIVEKKGRTISDATYTQLRNAITALNKLVEKADREREENSDKNKKKEGDTKMTEQEVKKLKDEILVEVTTKVGEQLKPLIEALKVLIPEKKEEDSKEPTNKDEKVELVIKTNVKVDDKETLTKTIGELQETIRKYKEEKEGKSNSLKGQDDAKDKEDYTYKDHMDDLDRDGYGRRKKKKEPEKK
jgi:hypothetical protein